MTAPLGVGDGRPGLRVVPVAVQNHLEALVLQRPGPPLDIAHYPAGAVDQP